MAGAAQPADDSRRKRIADRAMAIAQRAGFASPLDPQNAIVVIRWITLALLLLPTLVDPVPGWVDCRPGCSSCCSPATPWSPTCSGTVGAGIAPALNSPRSI